MLLSRKLLNDVNPIFKKLSDVELTNLCIKVGIEVERVIHHHEMKGLSICYLEEVERHPNADKLSVAKVRLSKTEVVTVVCGAENIKAKKYAIYAPVGTAFLDGRVIERKEIRGVDSCGMLCGFQELTTVGLENISDEDADGIVILSNGTLGDTNIGKYINNDDVIFDLSIPSNRNDLNSIYNLEHELCFGLQAKSVLANELNSQFRKQSFKIDLNNELASDFGLIHIKEWPKYKTPWTQREILMSSGYKVRNNILDLLNMFSLMYGNPIHVYSGDKVDPKAMSVGLINKATSYQALDGKTYEIPAKSIGIFNHNEIINVAGIIGSDASKYNFDTSLVIEVANFNCAILRNTAQKMKISTKAQSINSKPLSSWITQHTFFMICDYLKEHDIKFQYGYSFSQIKPLVINYKEKNLLSFLGVDNVKYKTNEVFTKEKFFVHPSRLDIQNEYDVYEEILKIIDINALPEKPIAYDFKYSQSSSNFDRLNKFKQALIHYGLIETKTYNLTSEANISKFNFWNNQNHIAVTNPIAKHREIMRVSLIDEMLRVIQYNIARKRQLYNIFEMTPIADKKNPMQDLSLIFCQPPVANKINHAEVPLNLLTIKSILKNVFTTIGIDINFKIQSSHVKELYNNQMAAIFCDETLIGYVGQVKNTILKKYDIQQHDVFAVSFNMGLAMETRHPFKLQAVSSYPTVYRDVNLIAAKQFDIAPVIDAIKEIEFVVDCSIKDTFDQDDNTTTYTLTLKLSSLSATLQTSQIDSTITKVQSIIAKFCK